MDAVAPIFMYSGILLATIFVLQVGLLMIGMTGPEIPDVDGPDLDMELDIGDIDTPDIDVPSGDFLSIFGLRGVPLLIWVSAWLAGFTIAGFALAGLLGKGLIIMVLSTLIGFVAARLVGRTMAKFLPSVETSAVSLKNARNLHGVITDGTARTGRPARVLVKDHHGGNHYLMAEPLDPQVEIHEGEQVMVVFDGNEKDPQTGDRIRRLIKV